MFNVGGPEFLVILLVALVVLGPTRLPDALRQLGKFVGEARKISTNFQNEVQEAMKDPVKKTTGKSLPKDAKEIVGFAVNEPFQAQEATAPEAPANAKEALSTDSESSASETPASDGPRFHSAEPAQQAKPAEPAEQAKPTEPAEQAKPAEPATPATPGGSDKSVEPAQIASAADISKVFESNGSSPQAKNGSTSAAANEDDSGNDDSVPMFGDR